MNTMMMVLQVNLNIIYHYLRYGKWNSRYWGCWSTEIPFNPDIENIKLYFDETLKK